MTGLLLTVLQLLPLDATPPATPMSSPAYATQGHGFAAYILGGFFALGLLVLAMLLTSLKPKRVQRPGSGPGRPPETPLRPRDP